jgi:NADH-quinone oxidoreductase subunit J
MNPEGFPGAVRLAEIIFVISGLTVLAGALLAVMAHRIIRSVCGLALCCIGLAGLYAFLQSPFLALMQILIYVGAVCITIVFAVMLAEPDEPGEPHTGHAGGLWLPCALLICAVVGWALATLAVKTPWVEPAVRTSDGSLKAIGMALLTTHSLAFEVVSVVLLVAIVGALAIAHGGRGVAR